MVRGKIHLMFRLSSLGSTCVSEKVKIAIMQDMVKNTDSRRYALPALRTRNCTL
jgi:hypothetical protein